MVPAPWSTKRKAPGAATRQSRRMSIDQVSERLTAIVKGMERGEIRVSEQKAADMTVAELAERFMKLHVAVNCKPRTALTIKGALKNHILPVLGQANIGAVGPANAAALQYGLRGKPDMANKAIGVLSQMYRLAEAWELMPPRSNPCRLLRMYPARARERFLKRDEYRRLGRVLAEADAEGRLWRPAIAAIRLLILTGCRRDEILTLRWDDVDRAARELRLRDTKTGPRMVAITAPVRRVLDGISRVPGNPWVIRGRKPGVRLKNLQYYWNTVRGHAGLDGVRLHDLRHSYASRALAIGESLSMICKLLNHSDIATTARYVHLMSDALRVAAARVGDSIGTLGVSTGAGK